MKIKLHLTKNIHRILCGISTLGVFSLAHAQVSLTENATYTQKFETGKNGSTAVTTPTEEAAWINNQTIIGWYAYVNGTAVTHYHPTTGGQSSITKGNFPNKVFIFRDSGVSHDGSLGTYRHNETGFIAIGAAFRNDTSKTITGLTISYLLAQWQNTNNADDGLDFQYSVTATSLNDNTATWVDVSALSGGVPKSDSSTGLGKYVGNNPSVAYGTAVQLTSSITGLSIASGQTFWLRWVDRDSASGREAALGVDDFTLTATFEKPEPSIPEPTIYTLIATFATGTALLLRRRKA